MKSFCLLLIAFCLLCFINRASAQKNKPICSGFKDTLLHKFVYKTVDSPPQPEGGMKAITKLISKNYKYPAGDADYTGRVLVAFVIETNGKIDGKRIIYDPSGNNHLFSQQLLNILCSIKWRPGLCNAKAVPTLYVFPLNIDIQE